MDKFRKFQQMLSEGISQQDLADILCKRFEMRYPDVYSKYDYDTVYDVVDNVASFHAGAEELGSSDIGIMIREIIKQLENSSLSEANGDTLLDPETALNRARNITKQYKYADMHTDIILQIQKLAQASGINPKDLEYYIDDVYEKQRELESAIFGLDQPFEDAVQNRQWQDDEVDEGQIYSTGGGAGQSMRWYTPKDNLGEGEEMSENLHKWFKEKWVRFGPDGKIRGDCARGDDSEGKPKCLPQSKAHSLGKKGRASAAARKRREDPNPERSGKAINVNTKKKTNEEQLDEKCWTGYKQVGGKMKGGKMVPNCVPKESVHEEHQQCPECGGPMFSELLINEKKDACYYKVKSRYKVWPSAYASGALVKCRKKGASNWGTGGKKNEGMVMGVSSDASSAGSKVQGEAANPAQQAAIAIAMKKAGKKPKRESAIMKGLVDETLGTPYPGTYEQETSMIKRKGPQRITAMTYENKQGRTK